MQVFLTTPWVPPEWIKAHGHEPRGIWWLPGVGVQNGPPGAGICAFAQSVCAIAETQQESATVFTSHCDQLRRGFDAVVPPRGSRTFLFNLPATWQTPAASQLFQSELTRLSEFLVELGGSTPSAEHVEQAMSVYNAARDQLLRAAAGYHGRSYAEAVAAFHWNGSVMLRPEPTESGSPSPNLTQNTPYVPLALIGGPLPRVCWQVFELVKQHGGRVVVNGTECGERSLGTPLGRTGDNREKEPRASCRPAEQALTNAFLERCVEVFQRPNTRLYEWLSARVEARRVRGILLWQYVGCDLWRAEAESIREALELPLLVLEPEASGGISPRMAGRIQAFLESLK